MMKNVLGIVNLHENEEMMAGLTKHRPLAAIPFGGRFRLIDFVLSNMVNSGINHVGILTQARFRSLLDHLRSGKEWDLARKRDGLAILPAPDHIHYANSIYKGDLEYIYNNLDFISRNKREYVLLAGSHIIGNVNYADAFRFHQSRGADITVLYKTAAPRQGRSFHAATLLTVDDRDRVTDMEVRSTPVEGGNIGMETFILSKRLLLELVEDCVARGMFDLTKEGFIRNLSRLKVYGYHFRSYLAKVNSVQAYYQANMELIDPEVWQELFVNAPPIYTKVKDEAPANYRDTAEVSDSLVANGCYIEGRVENCVLSRGVHVGPGAHIKNCVIMQNCQIGAGARLEHVICDKEVVISPGKQLTGDPNFVLVLNKRMVV